MCLVKLSSVTLCFFLCLVSAMTELQLLYNWVWSYHSIPDFFPFYASVFSLTGRIRPPVATDQHRIHLITGFSLGQENWSRDFLKQIVRYQLLHTPTIQIRTTQMSTSSPLRVVSSSISFLLQLKFLHHHHIQPSTSGFSKGKWQIKN